MDSNTANKVANCGRNKNDRFAQCPDLMAKATQIDSEWLCRVSQANRHIGAFAAKSVFFIACFTCGNFHR